MTLGGAIVLWLVIGALSAFFSAFVLFDEDNRPPWHRAVFAGLSFMWPIVLPVSFALLLVFSMCATPLLVRRAWRRFKKLALDEIERDAKDGSEP